MPAIPALSEPLSDGIVTLRPYAERDIPEILIAYQDDPQLHLRQGRERPPSAAQLGTQAEEAETAREAGEEIRLTILEAGTGDVCRGRLKAHHFNWEHLHAELGIWLAPQVRGRGIAVRALRLVSEWLFEQSGLARIELITEPDNAAMLRAAERTGFVREGVLRAYLRERGRRVDMVMMSLLPSDLEGS
jgi:RimJ/RimL family protein N-acetyltransferase